MIVAPAARARFVGAGLKVMPVAEAAAAADLVMFCAPDELQADIYRDHVAGKIRDGAAIAFAACSR